MRPQSIIIFERIYLASIALDLLYIIASGMGIIPGDPGMSTPQVIIGIAASLFIPLLLWSFIARKGSNTAKWVLVALFAVGILLTIPSILLNSALLPMSALIVTFTVVAMRLVAIIMLFRADAVAWLKGETFDAGEVFD